MTTTRSTPLSTPHDRKVLEEGEVIEVLEERTVKPSRLFFTVIEQPDAQHRQCLVVFVITTLGLLVEQCVYRPTYTELGQVREDWAKIQTKFGDTVIDLGIRRKEIS